MPDVMEPTRIGRPEPYAVWIIHVPATPDVTVRRQGNAVQLLGWDRSSRLTLAAAADLGAAISAAAEWTDSDVVSAEIVDDRPRIEYRHLVEGLSQTRPLWMADAAARRLGEDLAGWLSHCTPVVIVQDGKEWAP